MRNAGAGPGDESMDLRELGFVLSRGRRWIVGGALLGLLAGAAVLWLVAPRYEGRATILLRSQSAVGGGASALSELSDLLGNLPINLGGSVLETESTILTSRAVLGEVVDSLGLRVEVVEPKAVAPMALFSAVRLAPEIRGGEYRFELQGDSYRVIGPGVNGTARRGGALSLRGGELTLATGELPGSFTVRLRNRESAIEALEDDLRASVLGGEVVRILYRSTSPELSAAVPNLVIARYLERRRTTDRGVNQHRYEFLRDHVASMAVQLAEAESALRRHQESSRVFDPVLTAESGVRRVSELRGELETAQVEARALQGILSGAGSGNLSARELAAYPTFIVNPAINGLLSRLLDLETQRVALLERRPPNDPEIVPLSQSIAHLESRLVAISTDYLGGLLRREAEIRAELGAREGEMDQLPAHAEVGLRLEREVRRLSETQIALQTQLVAAQLAAISEGGDVRQVDVAIPPDEPVFPHPVLSLVGGLLGGLFFGTVAAVGAGRLRRRVCNPLEAEIATGIPTLLFGPNVPLSFPELEDSRSLLLIPVDASAEVVGVGERIASTAALQGREAVLADLTRNGAVISPTRFADHVPVGKIVAGEGAPDTRDAVPDGYAVYQAQTNGYADGRATLARLEERSSLVVAALPHAFDVNTVAVLGPGRAVVVVARAGITQDSLQETIDSCTRMGARVVRIVLHPLERRR